MRSWDAIVIGAGIIGLSLARELNKAGLKVLVVERHQPGGEASHAAAGMLADSGEILLGLADIASASARMYPEFVREVEDESGMKTDLREHGTIVFADADDPRECDGESASHKTLAELEPNLAQQELEACVLEERSVDPRALTQALWECAKRRNINISSGAEILEVLTDSGKVAGARTAKASYRAPIVVNCAGAWAGNVEGLRFPVRPVKGQMLCVVGAPVIKRVVRTRQVYLVPRSDGRIVIGSTLEEAGFDKRVDPDAIQHMHKAALAVVPALRDHRIHDSWAGLRPGTPDGLPILGETETAGYFLATGHFRDGILLAPVSALLMAQLIRRNPPMHDLQAFSPQRFKN